MNASKFMDKQIMDLSRSSKSDNPNPDLPDLMNPQSEEEEGVEDHHHHHHHHHEFESNDGFISKKNQEILPNYDFHPVSRPINNNVSSAANNGNVRDWSSLDDSNKSNSSPLRSYSSLDRVEPDKIVLEKSQKVNDSAILSEIDRTVTKHTDALMHAIGSLSARLSHMESRTRQLEHSIDDLKVSIGNNHGSTDGKLRQLENILLEKVQTGVRNVKDKQDVFEGHMQLAKLQISKPDQSSTQLPNSLQQVPVQQAATAAASAPPQQSGFQQFPIPVPQPPSMTAPPSQHNNHPPLPMTSQFPLSTTPPGTHRDAYLPPPSQTSDTSNPQYQLPPVQNQQPAPPAPLPQQYQPGPTPPYSQPPHPPQQQHPSIAGLMGQRSDESPYVPPQTYTPNLYQPASQPSGGPPSTQTYYGNPSPMYEPPPPPTSARSNSSFSSSYGAPSGPSEPYPYSGPTSHYGGGPPAKPQPRSPRDGSGNYPQLPTARVLPQAIPTASGVSGGSSSGGSGNKVPIDDVVDKVTNMGFSRDQVRATVRRLTENGQSVDLNIVLDKLMNDADVQPPKGWFGR